MDKNVQILDTMSSLSNSLDAIAQKTIAGEYDVDSLQSKLVSVANALETTANAEGYMLGQISDADSFFTMASTTDFDDAYSKVLAVSAQATLVGQMIQGELQKLGVVADDTEEEDKGAEDSDKTVEDSVDDVEDFDEDDTPMDSTSADIEDLRSQAMEYLEEGLLTEAQDTLEIIAELQAEAKIGDGKDKSINQRLDDIAKSAVSRTLKKTGNGDKAKGDKAAARKALGDANSKTEHLRQYDGVTSGRKGGNVRVEKKENGKVGLSDGRPSALGKMKVGMKTGKASPLNINHKGGMVKSNKVNRKPIGAAPSATKMGAKRVMRTRADELKAQAMELLADGFTVEAQELMTIAKRLGVGNTHGEINPQVKTVEKEGVNDIINTGSKDTNPPAVKTTASTTEDASATALSSEASTQPMVNWNFN